MRKLLLIGLLALAGCAGNLRLLEDGKSHAGTWNSATKTLEATIDGRKYSGSFSQNATVGFGNSFVTATSSTRTAYGSGFGTAVSSDGSGQAIMTSEDGKVIQCVFQAAMGRGQGRCEGLDGRRYVLVIGPMPSDAPAADAKTCNHGVPINGRCGS
jgi:hypothetical protein